MTSALDDRISLGLFPTPLQNVPSVPGLALKRDDLSGFGAAGNKTRPLEYLIADALEARSTCVVSGGMPTSNFIGALAEAACRHGLHCHLLVPEPVTATMSVALARLLGATVEPVSCPRETLDECIALRAQELSSSGREAYAIPRGGATPVGAMGFYRAVIEIAEQQDEPATIVIPVGSGASMAGLVAGTAILRAPFQIIGVSVSRPVEEIELTVMHLAGAVVERMGGHPGAVDDVRQRLVDCRRGPAPEARRDAVRAMACAGVLMDGHYGLPAWSVAAGLARKAAIGRIILWHTGGIAGVPSLLNEVQEG